MRVTNGMLITNMMRNYNRNLVRMEDLQNQLATGQRIRRPSDDPVNASKTLKLRSDLSTNEQYLRNIDNGISWLNITETALRDIGDSLQRARELTVRASSHTMNADNRAAVADEIEQIQRHILQVSNSTYAGRHIFAGHRTDYPAFSQAAGAITFNGNAGEIVFEVSLGSRIPVNVSGGPSGLDLEGLYSTLESLRNALDSPTVVPVDHFLTSIDNSFRTIMAHRSAVGAKTNRFEMIRARLEDSEVNFTELLSRTQDADIAEVMMNLREAEAVYNASLATGARIIVPTLVDFLR